MRVGVRVINGWLCETTIVEKKREEMTMSKYVLYIFRSGLIAVCYCLCLSLQLRLFFFPLLTPCLLFVPSPRSVCLLEVL